MLERYLQLEIGGLAAARVQIHQDIRQIVENRHFRRQRLDLFLMMLAGKQEEIRRPAAAEHQQQPDADNDEPDSALATLLLPGLARACFALALALGIFTHPRDTTGKMWSRDSLRTEV